MKYPKGHKAKKNLADMQDNNGETALHLAAKSGRAKIVMELLNPEIGPDWNIRYKKRNNSEGFKMTPIYILVPVLTKGGIKQRLTTFMLKFQKLSLINSTPQLITPTKYGWRRMTQEKLKFAMKLWN